MFIAEGVQTNAELREQREIDAVVTALEGEGYRPIFRSMLAAACDVASVAKADIQVDLLTQRRRLFRNRESRTSLIGDLIVKDNIVFVIQPVRTNLHIWQIRHHSFSSELDTFCAAIESTIKLHLDGRRVRGMSFDWKPIKERNRRHIPSHRYYQDAKLQTKPVEYSREEAEAAKLLLLPQVRTFILRLARAGKARAMDAAADIAKLPMDELVEKQLIQKEYLVLCRKDSHTICAIKDPSELESELSNGFSCTVCGRPLKDEVIQEIYALSTNGRNLLTGSRWMTIWVTGLLVAAGVSKDGIAWNAIASEDELDIMTDTLGPRVFFELKDREFGLGDAYPFAYRVSRYGGAFGIVVTTEQVADEAKKFFKEERSNMGAEIVTVEGQAEIEKDIAKLVDEFSRRGVMLLLSELAEPMALDPRPIVSAWMKRIDRKRTIAK